MNSQSRRILSTGGNEEDLPGERLSSEDLGALIVDALVVAGIVAPHDVRRAIRIAEEEIEARKGIGDY